MKRRTLVISIVILIGVFPNLFAQQRPILYFFPFRTNIGNQIESFDHPQAPYVFSYPEFLSRLFSSIEALAVHDYSGLLTTEESSGRTGFSNWSIGALQKAVELRNDPLAGHGITGFLEISETGTSRIHVTIFDMETAKRISNNKYEPKMGDFLGVLVGSAIDDIVYNTNIAEYFKKQTMDVHESMIRTPKGFLIYLKLQNEWLLDSTLKRQPDYFSQMNIVYQGFTAQRDFLVLQMMYIQILKDINDHKPFLNKMREIDALMQGKTDEYVRVYRKAH